eukprot:6175311-Pleurochrysis_carterae.AAC.1
MLANSHRLPKLSRLSGTLARCSRTNRAPCSESSIRAAQADALTNMYFFCVSSVGGVLLALFPA